MKPDFASLPTSDRRIALLIDADNVSHAKIAAILAELSKFGTTNIRRAYGDWTKQSLRGWTEKLHPFAIRPIQQFNYSSGKNATDIALVIDAMELHYTQRLDAFCIVSSDGDYTPLVMQLRANGHDVYGFGERKTPAPFVNACTTFLYVDGIGDPDAPGPTPTYGQAELSAESLRPATSLAKDETLIAALRGGVEAAAREDGWALVSSAGHAIKRLAPVDPRNYGVKNLSTLFEETGLFDVVRADSGQPYVADRRNARRASSPQA